MLHLTKHSHSYYSAKAHYITRAEELESEPDCAEPHDLAEAGAAVVAILFIYLFFSGARAGVGAL